MIRAALVLLTLLLSGCAIQLPTSIESTGVIVEPELRSPYADRKDAVGSLLNSAWEDTEAGDLANASGTLSRAMRIKPTDPAIYYQLAVVRKRQGEFEQARQLATRALRFGPSEKLQNKLQRLLQSLNEI